MTTALITNIPGALTEIESPIQRLIAQKAEIQHAMRAVMHMDQHYGVVPGTEKKDANGKDISKPSLFQPGADTLCFLFRLTPEFEIVDKTERDDLVSYDIRCVLRHIDTTRKWGEGMGACNSREKRYQSQASAKICPKCNKPSIIKGKADYGGGWLCWEKKGGCGMKYSDGDKSIVDQEGQATSTGVWDLKNTILKMACKRAKVAAVLTATAASDCFTQDLEDLADAAITYTPPKAGLVGPPAEGPPKWTSGTENVAKREPIRGFADEAGEDDPMLTSASGDLVDIIEPKTGEVLRREPRATSGQIARIHATLRDISTSYPDARYRSDLKASFCKEHANELSIREAGRVIDRLDRRRAKVAPELEAQAADSAAARADRGITPTREPGQDEE